MKAINIIIDDSIPTLPIFIEIENDAGKSVKMGEYIRTKVYSKIRITEEDLKKMK